MEPRETSDAEFIAASLEQPEQFAALFDRHYLGLYAYVRRRIAASAASEICSETFLIAFECRHRFDRSNASARAWIFGIALNLLRRHYRQERRQLAAYARTGIDPARDELLEAENRISGAELGRQIAAQLSRLADKDREALLLFAWAEFSYAEIAAATGAPIGTVKSRIARARRLLRGSFGDSFASGQPNEGASLQ